MTPDRIWTAWNADPLILFGIAALAYLYWQGTRTVWRLAGAGRGIRFSQAGALAAGVWVLAVALVSPLDALSGALFSAHMAQHLLLVTLAAPLIAAANPALGLMWAWPSHVRRAIGRRMAHLRVWRVVSSISVAFVLHSLALWLWHVPVLYEAALRSAPLHALEHLTLLGTGVLFWSTIWAGWSRPGPSILYVFALGAQCTGLGALITFAGQPWYRAYTASTLVWGVSALDDQVLAGALMWVPAGFVYLALALLLLGAWLRPLPVSAKQKEAH